MEVKKTEKQIKEVDVVTEHYHLCDKCNEIITCGSYNAFKFEFRHRTGDSYPEGGSGEEDSLDLCQDCAESFIQMLKDNGYRVTTKEWDF